MINILNIFFLFALIATVLSDRWVFEKSDHDVIDRYQNFWYIKVNRRVNRPTFPAYIRFYNKHTAKSEYDIECSSSSQIIYYNDVSDRHQLIWRTTDYFWIEGDSYYITLDEGVLFSDASQNSTEYSNPKFWPFTVIHPLNPSRVE